MTTRPWLDGVDLDTLTPDETRAAIRSALLEIAARDQIIETLTAQVGRLMAEVDDYRERDSSPPPPPPPLFIGPQLPPPCVDEWSSRLWENFDLPSRAHEYPDPPRNGKARCGKCHRVYIVGPPDPDPEFLP